MNKILPKTFDETEKMSEPLIKKLVSDTFYYEVSKDELIEVVNWVRYPSYDFLYGVPIPESPRYVKEIACMVIRYKGAKSYAHYFDVNEARDTIEALLIIYNKYKKR